MQLYGHNLREAIHKEKPQWHPYRFIIFYVLLNLLKFFYYLDLEKRLLLALHLIPMRPFFSLKSLKSNTISLEEAKSILDKARWT